MRLYVIGLCLFFVIYLFQTDLNKHLVYPSIVHDSTVHFYQSGFASDLVLLVLSGGHAAALTLGNHIFISSLSDPNDQNIISHELVHVRQYKEEGVPKFLLKYTWYYLTRGYTQVPYEIEAVTKTQATDQK